MQRYCSRGQRGDDGKMGAKQTGKSLITKEGAVTDLPGPPGLYQPNLGRVPAFQPLGCTHVQLSSLQELPQHRFAQRVVAFSPAQAGHYQDFPPPPPKIYHLICSRRQTLGCCFKTIGCPAGRRRCNTLFFLSSWGIRDQLHTTGRVISTTIYMPVA